jgi:hypothetical protein
MVQKTMEEGWEENEDWCATCAIYDAEATSISANRLPFGGFCGSLELPISTVNVAFCRCVSPESDLTLVRFRFWSIAPEDSPMLTVSFYYASGQSSSSSSSSSSPKTVGIAFRKYPDSWPCEQERPFVEWLTTQAQKVLLEDVNSFAVCDFLEHEGLKFFRVDHRDETHGFSMVVLPPIVEHSKSSTMNVNGSHYFNPRAAPGWDDKNKALTLEEYARRTLIDRWKYHYSLECPICFDTCTLGEGIQITCGHVFCTDCISTYVKYKVADLSQYHENPFTCPVTSCRRPMQVIGCAKKLLSDSDMDKVRRWYKDIKEPPCWSLSICLSKRCNSEGNMRRSSPEPTNFHVYCDMCGVTWCELCLCKVKDGNHDEECDPILAIQFCQRYLLASEAIKQQCQEKYPWIAIYANSKAHDSASLKWVQEHGQVCPTCSTGIERSEGCFHMTCSCGTHFCYECGEQLFPPFYGTHHCWERLEFQDVD